MPRPVEGDGRYVPALDGLRALAVALVVGYHLGVPGMGGGLLGVGVFFTLSGFLITGVLLCTWHRTGRYSLGRFYLHRARRLLPAVVVLLVVVLLTVLLVDREALGTVGAQALGALLYVSNWQAIASGQSYFERFAGPGPLDHLWSLAVEEQFYLVWPLVLLVLAALPWVSQKVAAWVTGVLAAGSFGLMWWLASPGFDNTRAYEGTDTRAGGLLVGAGLALLMYRPGGRPRLEGMDRAGIDRWAVLGLTVIGLLSVFTDDHTMFLYRGGLLLLSLATAAVVAVVVQPESRVGAVLGRRPFTWVGERSYGIYLWHLPVVVFTPEEVLAEAPLARATALVALTVGLAALSWALVEDPIRRQGLAAVWRAGSTDDPRRRGIPAVAAATGALVLVATSALSAQALVGNGTRPHLTAGAVGDDAPPLPPDATAPGPAPTTAAAGTRPRAAASPAPTSSADPAQAGLRTRCTELVHVGDSTSIGLMDPAYQPDPRARIDAQYGRVGVEDFTADISGARSIVEHYKNRPNALEAVEARTDRGYDGCWTMAMGVNEAANQYAGGVVPFAERIDRVMRRIPSDAPVLWLTVRTLLSDGPYGDAQMRSWNDALVAACTRYPNMRVYDWRSEVQSSWFIYDDIHYSTAGYAQRARRIANALAVAFPADGPSPSGCLVRSHR